MHKKKHDYLLFYLCRNAPEGIILPYAGVAETVSVSLMAPSGDTSFRARPPSGGTGKGKAGSGICGTVGFGRPVPGSGASGASAPVRGSARSPTQEGGREQFARTYRRGTGGAHIDPSPVFQWDPQPPQGPLVPTRPAARRAWVRLDDAGLPVRTARHPAGATLPPAKATSSHQRRQRLRGVSGSGAGP